MSRMDIHYSSANVEHGTPQAFFDRLNEEFRFNLDVCATPALAKCERFYTAEQDGLAQRWDGRCWMNPPYGRSSTGRWMERAFMAANDEADLVVALVAARTDTQWFHRYAMKARELRFVEGRLTFEGSVDSAPFPSLVVVFDPGMFGSMRKTTPKITTMSAK